MYRTPITILTGFLGSGKTTLLNRALRDPTMANTAVVINEFGEVGLDHKLAAQSNDTILVLENGCLCCTVFGDLVATLNSLYHARENGEIPRFDHVLVETSGLADPSPLTQAFLSDPTLAGLYRLGTVISTIDAINGPGTLDRYVESARQIALADTILITKLDLFGTAKVEEAEAALTARLRCLNPAAKIFRADGPDFRFEPLLCNPNPYSSDSKADAYKWLNAAAYEQNQEHSHAHDRPHNLHEITSYCFVRDNPIPRKALELLLNALQQNLGPSLLRVKGIVHVAEEPDRPAVIQGAQHLLHNLSWLDRWPDADRRSRIVFITQGFDRTEIEDMIALIGRVAERTTMARAKAALGK